MAVNPVPDGYHTITPYLIVQGAERVLEFLETTFGAKTIHKMMRPDGTVGHVELQIGDSRLMLAEATEHHPARSSMLYLYLPDVDAIYQRALAAGATSIAEPADQFYGDRHCGVEDSSGNQWWVATHFEDVSPDELQRRSAARYGTSP